MAISVAAIGIFSAYMLYDLKQILDGGETNYISATLALYLDLFNVFQSLLDAAGHHGRRARLIRTQPSSQRLPREPFAGQIPAADLNRTPGLPIMEKDVPSKTLPCPATHSSGRNPGVAALGL